MANPFRQRKCLVVTALLLIGLVEHLYKTSARVLHELDALKQQNNELRQLAELKDTVQGATQAQGNVEQQLEERNFTLLQQSHLDRDIQGPGLDHEKLRRKIERGEVEEWLYFKDQLARLKNQNKSSQVLKSHVDTIIQNGFDHHSTIMADLFNLSQSDSAELWRQQEAEEMSALMQRRLHYLQNPSDCHSARKVVCDLRIRCGFGCQLHHLIYCLSVAYGMERTLILESRGWDYSKDGWETFFLPLSQTCVDRKGHNLTKWGPPDVIDNVQVIQLPVMRFMKPNSPYKPLSIPEDLVPRLMRFHGHPNVWLIGQFAKYLLRPQPDVQRDMDVTMKKLGFQTPIVGVHVRRTDKVKGHHIEAAFHSIDEYMMHVEEYYDMLEKQQPANQRRIYLATDDHNLLAEAKKKYPHYAIISDTGISQTAGVTRRRSKSSLRGIILDLHFLSKSNFLVCTFSSNVCRAAYEIMQTYYPDAANKFYSLDHNYHYYGNMTIIREAIYEHKAENKQEIDLNVSDLLDAAHNFRTGYSKGKNRRTGKSGLYPSYKAKEFIQVVPKYDNVPLNTSDGGENGRKIKANN